MDIFAGGPRQLGVYVVVVLVVARDQSEYVVIVVLPPMFFADISKKFKHLNKHGIGCLACM
jgi:hypothetical protein